MNYYDVLVKDLQALPGDKITAETADNALIRKWKTLHIRDMENLLKHLDDTERIIIDDYVIGRKNAKQISKETGIPLRRVYQMKEDALEKLLRLRHGAAYRP